MNNYYNTYNQNDPLIGFERGNLFDSLYDTYKNYMPATINPTNEKEYLMQQIQIYGFALNDLGLYLDIYPEDTKNINKRTEYLKNFNEVYMQYENKYGALSLGSPTLSQSPWSWDSSFPWEGDK